MSSESEIFFISKYEVKALRANSLFDSLFDPLIFNTPSIDFDFFLGDTPKVPYDLKRFFRWRNYQDYGTGVAGDMFVHAFSSLNYIISSNGPKRALSTGGLRYWKDGRNVPDINICLYDYPKTKNHEAFNASLRVNFISGSGGGSGFKLIGTEGAMEVSLSLIHI